MMLMIELALGDGGVVRPCRHMLFLSTEHLPIAANFGNIDNLE